MGACLSSNADATARRNAAIDAQFANDSMHVMMNVSSDQELTAKQNSGRVDTTGSGDGYKPRSAMDMLLEKKRAEAAAARAAEAQEAAGNGQQQAGNGQQQEEGSKNGIEHDGNVTAAAADERRESSTASTSCSTVPGDEWRGPPQ